MNLLCVYYSCYFEIRNNTIFTMPAYDINYWQKYLEVFDTITIVGEPPRKGSDTSKMVPIDSERIELRIIPENIHPRDFKNDSFIKKELNKLISNAESILIQPTSRKGMMAIEIAKRYNKPYMLEFTGDLRLNLKTSNSLLKRAYSHIIHRQIIKSIKDAKYALYVTKEYLQKVYPINGITCGCTDAHVSSLSNAVLKKRIKRINQLDASKVHIGLIGSYSGNRKGIDTAIKAISLLPFKNITLHILGFGSENDKEKWFSYADKRGVRNMLVFDKPLTSNEDVLLWIDNMDICILPSRSEGLPRCVVESNSRACPSITSNVCGLQELVESKWTHKPSDYRKLSFLIKEMLSNKEEMIKSAINNYNLSKEYTVERLNSVRNSFFEQFKKAAENIKTINN